MAIINNRGIMQRISVVIPTLNEAKNIREVFPRIPSFVDEIVVVDGQSTDGTIETIKEIRPDAKIIIERPGGKGKALKTGFENATGDLIVMMDADGSNDPGEMRQIIEPLLDGHDVSKGSRMLDGGGSEDMTLFRKFGNAIFVGLVNKIYGANYTDLCYGYRAFKKEALEKLNCTSNGFEIETQQSIRIWKAGLKIMEVPSFEAKRIYGESNLNSFKDGWRILNVIAEEYYKKVESDQANYDTAISKSEGANIKLNSDKTKLDE